MADETLILPVAPPPPANAVAARVAARNFVTNGGTEYLRFGPFEPGESVEAVFLYWLCNANPMPSGEPFRLDFRVFGLEPAESAAVAATGRSLFRPGDLPDLPLDLLGVELPVHWVATPSERWFMVVVESYGDSQASKGSAWLRVGSGDHRLSRIRGPAA